ncbi:LysR family transcriptional regulator [Magnetococcus sp. PR-3]|uniref:LysR family transcriptional regulator n=1 Tax=Magnetococcus sp. PR-3 TaxID=3120355 RepID=UPI002FCE5771
MDQIQCMRAFVQVADLQGFSRAARKLGLTPGAVSKHISALEAHLGVKLFHRTTRQLNLSHEGELYLLHSRQLLADLEEADHTVGQKKGEIAGMLRIAAPLSFSQHHLTAAVGDYLQLHPNMEIELELNERYIDLIAEGFDLAIRIGQLEDTSLMVRKLAPLKLGFYAAPSYLATHQAPEEPSDLSHHHCLLYTAVNRAPIGVWHLKDAQGTTHRIKVKGRLKANNGDILRQAACQGLGIVALPSFMLGDDVKQGRLKPILPHYHFSQGGIHAVFPPNRNMTRRVRSFIDFLHQRWRQNRPWD